MRDRAEDRAAAIVLAAAGWPPLRIARVLKLSERTAYRYLGRLRDQAAAVRRESAALAACRA